MSRSESSESLETESESIVNKIRTHLDGRSWQNLSWPVVSHTFTSFSSPRRFIVEYKLNILNCFLTLATSQTRNIIFLLLLITEFIVFCTKICTERDCVCVWCVFDWLFVGPVAVRFVSAAVIALAVVVFEFLIVVVVVAVAVVAVVAVVIAVVLVIVVESF